MLAVVPPYNNKHQREDLWLNENNEDCAECAKCK